MTAPTITSEDLEAVGLDPERLEVGGTTPSRSAGTRGGSAALIAGRSERRDDATGLNATETAFYREVLAPLRDAGVILRIDFEPEGLRVGPKGTKGVYWPDFRIQWRDGVIEFLEIKGRWLDDARAKIKAAAALHPYTFRAVTKRPRRDGGGFELETIGPWPDWDARLAAAQSSSR